MASVSFDINAVDKASSVLYKIQDILTQTGGKAGMVAGAFIGMGVAVAGALSKAVSEAQDYDQQIKGLMVSTGASADQTSRMVQVLDDAGIEFNTVTKAMKEMAKDGTEPSIEEIASLSDEFLKLQTGAERGQFLLDKFGKSGLDMARAMALGGDAIRQMNAAQQGGLILTEEAIQQSEEYRKNVDELSDAWRGFKIAVGNEVIPVINEAVSETKKYNEVMQDQILMYGDLGERGNRYRTNLEMVKLATYEARDAANAHADALDGTLSPAIEGTVDDLGDLQKANKDVVSAIMDITKAYQDSAAAGSAASRQRLIDLSLEKIEMLDGVAGFSAAEQEKALAFAQTAGVVEASAIREVLAIDSVSSAIANGTMKASDMKGVLQSLTNHTWSVQVAVQMQGLENLRSTLAGNAAANPNRTYQVGGRAAGGSVNAGTPYMVGERGPELIVPSSNGNVVPNNQMGGMDMKLLARTIVTAMQQAGV
jgi:hypothetical protein